MTESMTIELPPPAARSTNLLTTTLSAAAAAAAAAFSLRVVGAGVKTLKTLNTITLDEVSWHDQQDDCWVVIYDRVYDLTDFMDKHPGGAEILMEHAGRDATGAFRSVGHTALALRSLSDYLIGELPVDERLFRKPGGYILSDMPE